MDTNRIIVGVVLLGASMVIANLLFEEFTRKEKIVAGALIGAANGAFIGGALPIPAGHIAGAAVGAAIGGLIGESYDSQKRHKDRENR